MSVGIINFFGSNKITASSPALDADFSAFKTRVENDGGTLTSTEITAGNQLVLDMKTAGVFNTSVKAAYPFIGSSSAACKQNLISSSFTGTFSGGWTYDGFGVDMNGSDTTFNTGFNTSNFTLNNAHYCAYYSKRETVNVAAFGVFNGSGGARTFCFVNFDNYAYPEWADAFVQLPSSFNVNGVNGLILAVATSGVLYGYYNGSLDGQVNYGGGISAGVFTFGQRANSPGNNNPLPPFGNGAMGFASLGTSMTSTQSVAFSTAINTFATTLGRNTY